MINKHNILLDTIKKRCLKRRCYRFHKTLNQYFTKHIINKYDIYNIMQACLWHTSQQRRFYFFFINICFALSIENHLGHTSQFLYKKKKIVSLVLYVSLEYPQNRRYHWSICVIFYIILPYSRIVERAIVMLLLLYPICVGIYNSILWYNTDLESFILLSDRYLFKRIICNHSSLSRQRVFQRYYIPYEPTKLEYSS